MSFQQATGLIALELDRENNGSNNSSALSRKNDIVEYSSPQRTTQHKRWASAQSQLNQGKTSMRLVRTHNKEDVLEPLVLKPREICKTEGTKIPMMNRIQRQFADMEKLKNEMRLQVSKLSDHLQVKDSFLGNVCDNRVKLVSEKGTQTGENSQTHHRDQAKLRNSFFELEETNLISEIPMNCSDLISFSNSPILCSSDEDLSTVTGVLTKRPLHLLKSCFGQWKLKNKAQLEKTYNLCKSYLKEAISESSVNDWQASRPLSRSRLFTLLDEYMEHKQYSDYKRMKYKKNPIRCEQFLREFLQKKYNNNASKWLATITKSLHDLKESGDLHALFYCQLFRLFEAFPITYTLSIFLTKINLKFTEAARKFQRIQTKKDPSAQSAPEGPALLFDIIDIVYLLFKKEKPAATHIIEHLRPETLSILDYTGLLMAHKCHRRCINSADLSKELKPPKSPTIPIENIIASCRQLGVWVSPDLIRTTVNPNLSPPQFCH